MIVTLEHRIRTVEGHELALELHEGQRIEVIGARLIGPDSQFEYVIVSGEPAPAAGPV